MRTLVPVALALLTAGCLAPGERDPTRYPWNQPVPKGTYCIISLEAPSATGITRSKPTRQGNAARPGTMELTCNPQG